MSGKYQELANKVQIAINTIQNIQIRADFDTMNHLMGALQTLAQVREELENMKPPQLKIGKVKKEDTENGNADV